MGFGASYGSSCSKYANLEYATVCVPATTQTITDGISSAEVLSATGIVAILQDFITTAEVEISSIVAVVADGISSGEQTAGTTTPIAQGGVPSGEQTTGTTTPIAQSGVPSGEQTTGSTSPVTQSGVSSGESIGTAGSTFIAQDRVTSAEVVLSGSGAGDAITDRVTSAETTTGTALTPNTTAGITTAEIVAGAASSGVTAGVPSAETPAGAASFGTTSNVPSGETIGVPGATVGVRDGIPSAESTLPGDLFTGSTITDGITTAEVVVGTSFAAFIRDGISSSEAVSPGFIGFVTQIVTDGVTSTEIVSNGAITQGPTPPLNTNLLLQLGGAEWREDMFFEQGSSVSWELGLDDYGPRVSFADFERKILIKFQDKQSRENFRQMVAAFGAEERARVHMVRATIVVAGTTYFVWRLVTHGLPIP